MKKGVSETFRLELPLENTVSPMDPILMNLQECHLIDLLVFSDGKADGAMTGDLG